jgi:hypothetical protein
LFVCFTLNINNIPPADINSNNYFVNYANKIKALIIAVINAHVTEIRLLNVSNENKQRTHISNITQRGTGQG